MIQTLVKTVKNMIDGNRLTLAKVAEFIADLDPDNFDVRIDPRHKDQVFGQVRVVVSAPSDTFSARMKVCNRINKIDCTAILNEGRRSVFIHHNPARGVSSTFEVEFYSAPNFVAKSVQENFERIIPR